MIKSVVREYKWSPSVLEDLFFDAEDYRGLYYWYEDLKEMHDEVKKQQAKNSKK